MHSLSTRSLLSLWRHPHPQFQATSHLLSLPVDSFYSFLNFTCKSIRHAFFYIWLLPLSIMLCFPAYTVIIIHQLLDFASMAVSPGFLLFSCNYGCPQLYLLFLQAKKIADFLSKTYHPTCANWGLSQSWKPLKWKTQECWPRPLPPNKICLLFVIVLSAFR